MLQLNEYQESAVKHMHGPCLVIAVPGSGKTRILTLRAIRLVEQGIKPQRIVCLTFTNKAADEMKRRICDMLQTKEHGMFIGTFHSLCVKILRKFGHHLGYTSSFTIADTNDQKDMIMQCSRRVGFYIENSDVYKIMRALSLLREKMAGPEAMKECLEDDNLIRIANNYLETLQKENVIDFSGLLYNSICLMNNNQDVRQKIQSAVEFLQIDEFQDTNAAQFELIDLLSSANRNIFCVGDINQSIYRWRFAQYENINKFMDKHKDCVRYHLPLNYRSTPQIIKAADTLIKINKSRIEGDFITQNANGDEIVQKQFNDQNEESEWIAKYCYRLIEEGGWDPQDIAILYRMNSQSEPVERTLTNAKLNYVVIGNRNFYDRKEIRDILAMLKFMINHNDGIAFHRLSKVVDGIGETTVSKIEELSIIEGMNMLDAFEFYLQSKKAAKLAVAYQVFRNAFSHKLDDMNVAQCMEKLIECLKYEEYLEKNNKDDFEDRIDNIKGLLDGAANFSTGLGKDAIESYLQMVSLVTAGDRKSEEGRISLMTLHASKGLEYPVIIIIGVEQGILPHVNSMNGENKEEINEGLEEERRLCFVGMTRAERILIMTHCKKRKIWNRGYTQFRQSKPSQFLLEAGLLQGKKKVYG